MLADPAPEDHGDLVGLADRAIGVEQALTEFVQRRHVKAMDLMRSVGFWKPSNANSETTKSVCWRQSMRCEIVRSGT
jgi:hypothetical protein